MIFNFIFVILVFLILWNDVETGQLVLSEGCCSIVAVLWALAGDATVGRGEKVSLGALSVDVDVMANEVDDTFSFKVYLRRL